MERVIVWGAGGVGQLIYDELVKVYEIIAYVDSDERKWADTVNGIPIKSPKIIDNEKFDHIVIGSVPGFDSIMKILRNKGIAKEKIVTKYVETNITARETFLKNYSQMIYETKKSGG